MRAMSRSRKVADMVVINSETAVACFGQKTKGPEARYDPYKNKKPLGGLSGSSAAGGPTPGVPLARPLPTAEARGGAHCTRFPRHIKAVSWPGRYYSRMPTTAPETLHLWRNARIAACDAAMTRFAAGALLTRGPRIEWVGAERDLPADCRPEEIHDLAGAWVTPGLIDCHTHLVFAGTRAAEYAERLRGRSYEEICPRGRRHSLYHARPCAARPSSSSSMTACRGSRPCSPRESPRSRSSPAMA